MRREVEQPADELRLGLARSERERVPEERLEVMRRQVEEWLDVLVRWVERERGTGVELRSGKGRKGVSNGSVDELRRTAAGEGWKELPEDGWRRTLKASRLRQLYCRLTCWSRRTPVSAGPPY